MIVDANDLDVAMLGHCSKLTETDDALLDLIRDNPAGQDRQLTPFILIRQAEVSNETPQETVEVAVEEEAHTPTQTPQEA